jgi:hypothetical protein
MRGAHPERPNPAEAVPGIRPGDRPAVTDNAAVPPTPRNGAVRGTMGKPQLPRRRAQEHIAPQLREGPAPRLDSEEVVGHDPGLMAAFQRGIGLAEAQHLESLRADSTLMDAAPMESAPMGGAHMGRAHMDGAHMDGLHIDASHRDGPPTDASPAPGSPVEGSPMGAAHIGDVHTAHASAPHEALGRRESTPAPGHDLTARHDGSTPAG